jgi:hypothetical protein
MNTAKTIPMIDKAVKVVNDKQVPYATNSKKAYFQALMVSFDQLHLPAPAETRELYLKKFNEYKIQSAIEQEHKKKTEVVLKYSAYLKLINTAFGKESEQFLIASMYSEMPLRDDFQLEIVKTVADASDDELQYIVIPTSPKTRITIIINKYKTSSKYGQIKETASVGLSSMIRKFIASKDRTYGDFLFGTRKQNTDFVSKMNAQVDLKGGINLIRHMIASSFNYTAGEREELASRMKHSPLMSLNYIRQIE